MVLIPREARIRCGTWSKCEELACCDVSVLRLEYNSRLASRIYVNHVSNDTVIELQQSLHIECGASLGTGTFLAPIRRFNDA